MPSFATAFARTVADDEQHADKDTGSQAIFGSRLLFRLARIAGAANEDRREPAVPRQATHRSPPHHCEFDYDYYVALQSRRRHQPSRANRRSAVDADV